MQRVATSDRSASVTADSGRPLGQAAAAASGASVDRPSGREVSVVTGLLLLVAAAVFGRHVASGQFSSDDWSSLDAYRHLPDPGFVGLVRDYAADFGGKPLLAVFLSLPPVLFGGSVPAWLAMAVVLGTATAVCWYVLLRTLGLERWPAAAVAGLTLLAPWSSSGRLWATASVNNVPSASSWPGSWWLCAPCPAMAGAGTSGTVQRCCCTSQAC